MIRIDWWHIAIVLLLAWLLGSQAGCTQGTTALTQDQHRQNLETLGEYSEVAREHNLQFIAIGDLPTRVGMLTETSFGSQGSLRFIMLGGLNKPPTENAPAP